MRKRSRLIAVALGVMATVTLASGSSSAAATATLQKTQQFPVSGLHCLHRDIYLASGTYKWSAQIDGVPGYLRNIWLTAGTYYWTSCLAEQAGSSDYYEVSSSLKDYALSDGVTIGSDLMVVESGTKTWGAVLDPSF